MPRSGYTGRDIKSSAMRASSKTRPPAPPRGVGVVLAPIPVVALACPSPATFDGSVYRQNGIAFRVPLRPEEWRPLQVDNASLAFRDETHDASILVNGRCHVEDAPLVALT